MDIIVRQMETSEAAEVMRIGKRAFTGLESLFVGKPKLALVAVKDEKIVGAVLYKYFKTKGKQTGYVDFAFIDPDYHNQGIGGVLYKACVEFLWEQGCSVLTALVKDDNVGSWGLFLKNGFSRMSILNMIRQFGFAGMLRHYLGTPFCFGIGMEYYAAFKEQPPASEKGGSAKEISAYLLANLFVFILMLFFTNGSQKMGTALGAYMLLLAGPILSGYIAALFSKRRWRFRLNNGGLLVCILSNGNVPLIGNWYPDHYENTDSFRRELGIHALSGWTFILIISLFSILNEGQAVFFRYTGQIGSIFLLYRVLAFYPFESFGGLRVFCWKRRLYVLMAIASLAVFAVTYLL